ncbi:hypothetical protein ACHAW6_011220 [Cyclotella cf. meneghiniana]
MALPLGATVFSWLLLPPSIESFSPIQSSIHVHPLSPSVTCQRKPRSILPYVSSAELRLSASTEEMPQTALPMEEKSNTTTTATTTTTKTTISRSKETNWEMPWTEIQQYALQDNLPKYTVMIPTTSQADPPKPYAMWRTMSREVPELAGYPIPFLISMHRRTRDDANSLETPGLLPMVDEYEFSSDGGIAGRAYGLPGIADGTRIRTPSLIGVENTLPSGYVTAVSDDHHYDRGDGRIGFSYELGTCRASSSVYSLDGSQRSAALLMARRSIMRMDPMEKTDGSSARRIVSVAKDAAFDGSGLLTDAEANRDLVYLGGATAMLLASAAAVGMLSHHLTVNVFWV